MKRLLAIFLIVAVCVVAPDFAHITISAADFSHCSAQAVVAAALPSYKIAEWCQLRRYSRAQFYRMKWDGTGPDTIGSGRLTRITGEADERWLRKQERIAKAKREDKAE